MYIPSYDIFEYAVYAVLLLILVGLFKIKSLRPRILQNVVVSITSIIFCFIAFEIILKFGAFENHSAWNPLKAKKLNIEINKKNDEFSKKNPLGFNDPVRSKAKPAGATRIVVIGDSFIWGDGLPREEIWSVKLEKLIADKYTDFELFSWGKNGWSTKDQLNFLRKDGFKYNIDLLVVSFVDNDPFLGKPIAKYLRWQNTSYLEPFETLVPEATNFIVSFINQWIYTNLEYYGYGVWSKKLYSKENLDKYGELLKEFSEELNKRGVDFRFILTVANNREDYKELNDKVIPYLEAADIKYLNLYTAVQEQLGHYNPRKLRANRANGHPGSIMPSLFAKETLYYIEKEGLLKPLSLKVK